MPYDFSDLGFNTVIQRFAMFRLFVPPFFLRKLTVKAAADIHTAPGNIRFVLEKIFQFACNFYQMIEIACLGSYSASM